MSFEFTSDNVLSDVQWSSLRHILKFGRYVLLPSTDENEIRLRWDVTSHRSEWPEDITIHAQPRLSVCIHVGDARQRHELVEFLNGQLGWMELVGDLTPS